VVLGLPKVLSEKGTKEKSLCLMKQEQIIIYASLGREAYVSIVYTKKI